MQKFQITLVMATVTAFGLWLVQISANSPERPDVVSSVVAELNAANSAAPTSILLPLSHSHDHSDSHSNSESDHEVDSAHTAGKATQAQAVAGQAVVSHVALAQPQDGAAIRADDIRTLPLEMQHEINTLSGRDGNATVVEIEPGVFLMTNGPRVVPIAVMNDNGTVTVHEY